MFVIIFVLNLCFQSQAYTDMEDLELAGEEGYVG